MGEAPGEQGEPVLLGEAPVRAGEVALGQGGHPAGLQLPGVLFARPHPGQVVQHKPRVVTLGATPLTHKYLVPFYLEIGFTKFKFGFMVHCGGNLARECCCACEEGVVARLVLHHPQHLLAGHPGEQAPHLTRTHPGRVSGQVMEGAVM